MILNVLKTIIIGDDLNEHWRREQMVKIASEAIRYLVSRFDEDNIRYDQEGLMNISDTQIDELVDLYKGWQQAFKSEANTQVGPSGNKKAKIKRKNAKVKSNDAKLALDDYITQLEKIF
jgi:hypothetical protein